jgi:hypothetical protein
MEEGKVKPIIHSIIPLDQIVEGFGTLEKGTGVKASEAVLAGASFSGAPFDRQLAVDMATLEA